MKPPKLILLDFLDEDNEHFPKKWPKDKIELPRDKKGNVLGYYSEIIAKPFMILIKHGPRFDEEVAFTAKIRYIFPKSDFKGKTPGTQFPKFCEQFLKDVLSICKKGNEKGSIFENDKNFEAHQKYYRQVHDTQFTKLQFGNFTGEEPIYFGEYGTAAYKYHEYIEWEIYIDSFNFRYNVQMEMLLNALEILRKHIGILQKLYSNHFENPESEINNVLFQRMGHGEKTILEFYLEEFYKISKGRLYFMVLYDYYYHKHLEKKRKSMVKIIKDYPNGIPYNSYPVKKEVNSMFSIKEELK